jgi:hypothetical protein
MAPMPMPMQGGSPVQMPQGVYMPQQAIYGPPVMMPGPGKGVRHTREIYTDFLCIAVSSGHANAAAL